MFTVLNVNTENCKASSSKSAAYAATAAKELKKTLVTSYAGTFNALSKILLQSLSNRRVTLRIRGSAAGTFCKTRLIIPAFS